MKRIIDYICNHSKSVLIISFFLLVFSFIGMYYTNINYDILVYLPSDIETIKGQNILTDEFNMGAYSIAIVENMKSKDILKLEEDISLIDGVNKVISIYDVIGTNIPVEMLPNDITKYLYKDNTSVLFITFDESTSAEKTINAVSEIRNITKEKCKLGGMSSMVLDTMELSEKEIVVYIVIAIILCIIVLELSLDSYIAPLLLLGNIGCAIVFNLGTNVFLGQISYITKALVAVLQLGVTTDFSIFLYHSYEENKLKYKNNIDAMKEAIKETFTSVIGSSLTTIAGFLVLCTMKLTLGMDLGIVMAKGVLIGVLCVLTLFPCLLLVFDKLISKTSHKSLNLNFEKLNKFIVNNHIIIFIIFLIILIPSYLGYKNIEVYYKIDKSLPETLESISTNEFLKEKYNIVSPEILLMSKDINSNDINNMINEISDVEGIDFVLSFDKLTKIGLSDNMLPDDIKSIFKSDDYEMILINSLYEVASDELNNQIDIVNKIVKRYDKDSIVAGEGALMKDLIRISDTDFKNVNYSSMICIFIILVIVLKSISLPVFLIFTIESAIVLNMSISYFGGVTLPFIAPIVLGTIQLGATIDYAILLTTSYIKKRCDELNKKEAMIDTLNYNGKSILISGLCFFAATFGVGVYSKLEMVGTLCNLISRGAIISMLIVIFVLPSVLLIFDKLFIKRSDKVMKKSLVFLIVLCLTLNPITTSALSKSEVVYGKLDDNGNIKNIYVNEHLVNNDKLDVIEDYSELKDILNINGNEKYKISNNKVTWDALGNDIFYQGKYESNLPIEVSITYKFNDEVMEIKNMIGKSGHVEIIINYVNKDKHNVKINGKNEKLYTPFVVTYATTLDAKNNSNISISNGKIISNGINNILVGMAIPGLYESLDVSELKDMDTIRVEYDTVSFELESSYSVISPKIIDSNDLEIFDKLDDLYSKSNSLQKNMNLIDENAVKLKSGSNELKSKLKTSIDDLSNNKGNALSNEELEKISNKTIDTINSMFTDDYKQNIMNNSWSSVEEVLKQNDSESVNKISENISDAFIQYLKDINEYDDYVLCEIAKSNNEDIASMESCIKIAQDITLPYVKKALESSNLKTAEYVKQNVGKKVSDAVSVSVAQSVASSVASSVSKSVANEVGNGVMSVSLETLSKSLNSLYSGVEKIDDGVSQLSEGITKFNNDGIKELTKLVNNDVKATSVRVKELVKLGENYKTIAGTNMESETKFILVTDAKKVNNEKVNKTETEEKVSFWQRIKNLFK